MTYKISKTTRLYACDACGTTRIGRERRMLGPCAQCGGFMYSETNPSN